MAHKLYQYFFSSIFRALFSLFLIVLAVFFVYTHFNGSNVNIDTPNMSVKRIPLTELFFTDYLALPVTIQAGQTIPIDFTIRNLEGRDRTYPYKVYLVTTGGRQIEVAEGEVEVANEAEATVHTSYTFRSNSLPVTFFVVLPTTDQFISAAVPVPTQ